jgi:hypothetical protein
MMAFDGFCATLIALGFGLVILCGGYRLFMLLLPIWGFLFGFIFGVQAIQALFGSGFLLNITSWIVGFVLGAGFALLAYLSWAVGVALVAGGLGYALGAGFMNLIGIDLNLLVWLIGIAVGIAVAIVTFRFNLQKYIIIVASALAGAGSIVMTLFFGAYGSSVAQLLENPVRHVLQQSPLWVLFYLVVAAGGIAVQVATTRDVEYTPYENRI